ncbi:hypothetical protein [Kitasatospora sp. NPDC088351]|uniref:hypothetical protein n=1 Tax=Kitasatospora sp. NPDC088351 TaxID=3155180 RepID=UPI00342AA850
MGDGLAAGGGCGTGSGLVLVVPDGDGLGERGLRLALAQNRLLLAGDGGRDGGVGDGSADPGKG